MTRQEELDQIEEFIKCDNVRVRREKQRMCNRKYLPALMAKYSYEWRAFFKENDYPMPDIRSIHYHHTDPDNKSFCISQFIQIHARNTKNEDLLRKEISKCSVLTNSEHGKLHQKMKHFPGGRKFPNFKLKE